MSDDVELEEIRNEFIDESMDGLSGAADAIIAIEKAPHDKDIIAGIFRTVHSIKGNAAFFGLMSLKNLAHRLEDVLSGIRNDLICPDTHMTSMLLDAVDALTDLLTRVRQGGNEVANEGDFNDIIERLISAANLPKVQGGPISQLRLKLAALTAIPNIAINHDAKQIIDDIVNSLNEMTRDGKSETTGKRDGEMSSVEQVAEAPKEISRSSSVPPSAKSATGKAKPAQKTMRIREESIDGFFKYVGELVVVGEMYEHVYTRLRRAEFDGAVVQLHQANESFRMLSMGLQQSILEIRKVPGKQLLGRVGRLVRDASVQTGKEVEVIVEGEDLQIDKAVSEALEAPLVHVVRNAVDHGIETPEIRVGINKPRHGALSVALKAIENMIQLSVSDDGRGIDREKLRRKAVESGLIEPDRALSDDDVVNLLFRPGVSTAEKVTDISGRGVGMDVVKREIEERGGNIVVQSEPGKGSLFQLKIPATVTTRIIQGIGIFSNGLRYIVPVDSVVRFFEFSEGALHGIGDQHQSIFLGGQTFPFASLSHLLGTSDITLSEIPKAGIGVLISKGRKQVAIQVDEVEANRQLVVKEIEGMTNRSPLFKGAAIAGDGTVSLVLDSTVVISEVIGESLATIA